MEVWFRWFSFANGWFFRFQHVNFQGYTERLWFICVVILYGFYHGVMHHHQITTIWENIFGSLFPGIDVVPLYQYLVASWLLPWCQEADSLPVPWLEFWDFLSIRVTSWGIYWGLPKSSKYLVRRCLAPLKAFSGGIWRSQVGKRDSSRQCSW